MNDEYSICWQTFYRIINNITEYEQVSLNTIDYVTSTIVNETCTVFQDIVDQVILLINLIQASNMIYSCIYFLKHKYSSHCVLKHDNVCYHGIIYGLSRFHTTEKPSTNCSAYKLPFCICDQLKKMFLTSVAEQYLRDDTIKAIQDT